MHRSQAVWQEQHKDKEIRNLLEKHILLSFVSCEVAQKSGTLQLRKADAINSAHLQFTIGKSSSYKMQWSNTNFSAAVGRSSLPEHHPSGCRTALSRCVPCSSAEGAPAAFPCSPSHQGRESWCVRHFLPVQWTAGSSLQARNALVFSCHGNVVKKCWRTKPSFWECSEKSVDWALCCLFAEYLPEKFHGSNAILSPCYTIKMGKSQVLAACSSIDTNHPVLSQCSRAAIIITTDMAKPVTLYSPSGVCVRADPRTISCLVAGWACCALTPGGVTSAAFRSHHRWNCTTNQNSSERQMMLKWKWWAHTWKTNLWDLSQSHFLILIKIKSWRKSHYIFHWFGALDFLRLSSAF